VAANREITPEDRLRVEEAATIVQLPSNREIIQVIAQNFAGRPACTIVAASSTRKRSPV